MYILPLQNIFFGFSGRPLPSVTWWLDGALVDSKYFTEAPDTVVNKLNHLRAERFNLKTILFCTRKKF